MAKIYTLKDREGTTLYPVTTPEAVINARGENLAAMLAGKVAAAPGKGLSEKDFTAALAAKLAGLPDSAALAGLLDAAAKRLLIDMWVNACTVDGIAYGGYDPATDLFSVNDVTDISTAEAIEIMALCDQGSTALHMGTSLRGHFYAPATRRPRALLPLRIDGLQGVELNNSLRGLDIRVLRITSNWGGRVRISNMAAFCSYCPLLEEIPDAMLDVERCNTNASVGTPFHHCASIRSFKIANLWHNIDFSENPAVSIDSLRYIVDNALVARIPDQGIAVQLHPVTFATLPDDLIADAAAIRISFTTA